VFDGHGIIGTIVDCGSRNCANLLSMWISPRLYATAINAVLALVLALNALGWAAHVDVPVQTDRAQGMHADVVAYAQSADAQFKGVGQTLSINDHCGHAHAHHAGLVESACHLEPLGADMAAPGTASRYVSIESKPPLGPPIA